MASDYHNENAKNFEELFEKNKKNEEESIFGTTSNENPILRHTRNLSCSEKESQKGKGQILKEQRNYFPHVTIPVENFYSNRFKIFRILHLLYQDMKMNIFYKNECEDLAFFLFCFAKYIDHELSFNYCDYYIREFSNVIIKFQNDEYLQQFDSYVPLKTRYFHGEHQKETYMENGEKYNAGGNFLEKEPPDILKWVEKILTFENSSKKSDNLECKMPIAFKLTKLICKIFDWLVFENVGKSYFISDLVSFGNPNIFSSFTYSQEINLRGSGSIPIGTTLSSNTYPQSNYPFFSQKAFSDLNKRDKFQNSSKETLRGLMKNASNRKELVFLFLVEKNVSLEEIDSFPLGISLPLTEILRNIRLNLPLRLFSESSSLPKLAFKLIKREDLYKNWKINNFFENNEKNLDNNLTETVKNIISSGNSDIANESFTSNQTDLLKRNNEVIFREVQRLLETTKHMKIKAKYLENIAEDRLQEEGQSLLLKYSLRRLSACVGQGAFMYGNLYTFITEVLNIPKINLSALLPPDGNKITLEIKEEKEQNLTLWPEFHNGVATGLKLSKNCQAIKPHHLKTWIFYQKPESPKFDHAGFLLALGLQGYLDAFSPTDVYQYLKCNHDATNIGILLGLSASRIGKSDENTTKTLCLHIHYLIPANYDMDIPLIVQTAAVVGIGFLHKGSCHRAMTEVIKIIMKYNI